MNLTGLLIVIALVLTILSAVTSRVPLWVAVLFLCLALLLGQRVF